MSDQPDRQTPEQIAREITDGIMSPKSTGSHPRTVYSTFVDRAETERIIAAAIRFAVNERLEMAAHMIESKMRTPKALAAMVRSLKFEESQP